jgi:hypothetical protein
MFPMAKKKKGLYADIDPALKLRLKRMADYNSRKITAELTLALEQYLQPLEKKAKMPPIVLPEEEQE